MSTDKDAQAFPVAGLASLPNGDFIHPGAGLTAREYAAIKLRVPDSGTDWLDKMILTAMRDELALVALAAVVLTPEYYKSANFALIEQCFLMADAVLAERSKT